MDTACHVWSCRTKRHPGRRFQKPHAGGRQSYQLFDKGSRLTAGHNQPSSQERTWLQTAEVPALSPGTHPEGGDGRLRPHPSLLLRGSPWAAEETWRKLAEGDRSLLSGLSALIKTKQGRCGKFSNCNEAEPSGAFLG